MKKMLYRHASYMHINTISTHSRDVSSIFTKVDRFLNFIFLPPFTFMKALYWFIIFISVNDGSKEVSTYARHLFQYKTSVSDTTLHIVVIKWNG